MFAFFGRYRLAALLGLLVPLGVSAQEFSPTPVFTFSSLANPANEIEDPNVDGFTKNPDVRPNTATEYTLYAFNPSNVEKTYTVELSAGRATASAKVTIAKKTWAKVKLTKPAPVAPPVAVPAPVPAATTPAVPPVAVEPPPPGGEVAVGKDGKFPITIRLLDADGKAVKDADGKAYGLVAKVGILSPTEYVTVSPKLNQPANPGEPTSIAAEVTAKLKLVGTATLKLGIPLQTVTSKAVLRNGFYERTLTREPGTKDNEKITATLKGSVDGAGEAIRIQVGVDGVDRAFIYRPDPAGVSKDANMLPVKEPAVRVTTAVGPSIREATQPVPSYAVRLEVDNPSAGSKLELWLRPQGAGDSAADNEVIALGGPREERLWAEPAGPGEGVLFTVKSKDWVKLFDARPLRGTTEAVGVLRDSQGMEIAKSVAFRLTVDSTAPDRIIFGKLPVKHLKGKPLPLSVTTTDPETAISKVVFYLAQPGEDGKLPVDAVKVIAIHSEAANLKSTDEWLSVLPLPADKKGEIFITAQVTNQAGLITNQTQKVILVDPPLPMGTIEGKVMLGERAQPGLAITLKDADGKLKANVKTNELGKFKFENVPAGKYTVATSRKDSVSETVGSEDIVVENEKTAKSTISLARPKK